MKILFFLTILLLSSCASSGGSLRVRSDLSNIKKEKTIFYQITDNSVLNSRLNKLVKKELLKKGWKVVKPDTKANFLYNTELTSIQNNMLVTNIFQTKNSFSSSTYNSFYYTPVILISITDIETKEHVYEATINAYGYDDMLISFNASSNELFKNADVHYNISCYYIENKKTNLIEAERECKLLDY